MISSSSVQRLFLALYQSIDPYWKFPIALYLQCRYFFAMTWFLPACSFFFLPSLAAASARTLHQQDEGFHSWLLEYCLCISCFSLSFPVQYLLQNSALQVSFERGAHGRTMMAACLQTIMHLVHLSICLVRLDVSPCIKDSKRMIVMNMKLLYWFVHSSWSFVRKGITKFVQ